MPNEVIKLTQFAHGSGCGCKIAPQFLQDILNSDNRQQKANPSLLVGNDRNDDAAVYQLTETEALIATTDFFTPVVDDPFIFGKVAAANALSDVYAMGGTPILALAILGWPLEKLGTNTARQVLEGARSLCETVNVPIAGGHSIDSVEPIFGLSVNGKVTLNHLKKNDTAKEGDVLFLTKPLGLGILATAAKRLQINAQDLQQFHQHLTSVNAIGEILGGLSVVHAMTDVTGFGLVGHLLEMSVGSGLTAILNYKQVPKIKGLKTYLDKNILPDATYRNWKAYQNQVKLETTVNALEGFKLLLDPQTNGGLLISVDPKGLAQVQEIFKKYYLEEYKEPIGYFEAQNNKAIFVK